MTLIKLRPPPGRDGLVHRAELLERALGQSETPVIAVVAPPGYGKTTFLGQFETNSARPVAWLTIDESDSDPVMLFANVSEALHAAGLIQQAGLSELATKADDALISGVDSLARVLESAVPGILVLDQVDHLRTVSSRDLVGALMTRLAGAIQVVVATRSGDGLPFGLLRAKGHVYEVTTADLAMDTAEATSLFEAVGLDAGDQLRAIVDQTEGWPAGLYLTAVAMKAGAPSPTEVHGDDVYLADYVRDELLSQVPEPTMSFLLRTSILSRLTGSLCDYLLERNDSSKLLEQLEVSNLLIVPMDRTRTWYRYHTLMSDYLRAELGRAHPELVPGLHSRAATWYQEQGAVDLAIDHAQQAGDGARFAALVALSGRQIYSEGRMETLSAWLTSLEETKTIVDYPELASLGAFARALDGDAGGADRLATMAFNDGEGRPLEDGDLGPFALLLRSYQAPRGLEQALADARSAGDRFGNTEEWHHVVLGAEALATVGLEGTEAADILWTEGIWRSDSLGATPFTAAALAERALAAIDRGDWDDAEAWILDACTRIEEGGLDRYITSALPFTLAARLAARAGDVDRARSHLAAAAAVRPKLTLAVPVLSVQTLHEMAKAFVELADVAGARRVMRDAADVLALRPRLGRIVSEHAALKNRLAELPAGSVGPSSLTTAELRLLPLLVTHLTYPEIGERLYVSRHTVKTQALSIYRKLGVSSRTDAVERARAVGLISL